MKYFNHRYSLIVTAVFFLVVGLYACDQPPFGGTEGADDNTIPETTMANVPVEGDTLFANVTLHWDGGDNDGFVEYYEWRYATIDPQSGDTLQSTGWDSTENTSLTITFSSPLPFNKQIFWVRAVDNKRDKGDAVSKTFFTEQTIPPQVEIERPSNNTKRFYLEQATDWFQGIEVEFTGEDDDGVVEEFGWAVDGGDYNWIPSSDTIVTIPPEAFGSEGDHTIILNGRDDTDLTSDDPDTINVTLIKPTFDKGILVIDETQESDFQRSGGEVSQYDDSDVDSMYSSWIEPTEHTNWDFGDDGMPDREVLGQYKMVFWHGDNWYGSSADAHKIGNHKQILSEYMNVGGDFIMSGWKMLKSLRPTASYPYTFQEGDFELDYLHIRTANQSGANPPGDMVGGNGVGDYDTNPNQALPDITIDSSKVGGYPVSFYSNMVDVNLVDDAAGFTSPIYTFECRSDCGDPNLRGKTIGIRYFGTSFDAVVFGFPIFFMKEEDAETIIDQILTNMGYRDEPERTIR